MYSEEELFRYVNKKVKMHMIDGDKFVCIVDDVCRGEDNENELPSIYVHGKDDKRGGKFEYDLATDTIELIEEIQ